MDRGRRCEGRALGIAAEIAALVLLLTGSANARIITVDDSGGADFTDIVSAINFANDGDTIIVSEGIYEGFTINKQLTFIGNDAPITGRIIIYADNTKIDSFNVEGFATGVVVYSNNNVLVNNIIRGKDNIITKGIDLVGSNNTLINNLIRFSRYGLDVSGSYNQLIDAADRKLINAARNKNLTAIDVEE